MGENHNDPTGSGSATQVVSTVGPIIGIDGPRGCPDRGPSRTYRKYKNI